MHFSHQLFHQLFPFFLSVFDFFFLSHWLILYHELTGRESIIRVTNWLNGNRSAYCLWVFITILWWSFCLSGHLIVYFNENSQKGEFLLCIFLSQGVGEGIFIYKYYKKNGVQRKVGRFSIFRTDAVTVCFTQHCILLHNSTKRWSEVNISVLKLTSKIG